MKRIGNNEFFTTLRGAKTAGSRRRYLDGSRIIATEHGYCLLSLAEGTDNKSYNLVSRGKTVARMHNTNWNED